MTAFTFFTSYVTVYNIKHKYIFKQRFVTVLKIQFYFIISNFLIDILFARSVTCLYLHSFRVLFLPDIL